MPAREKAHQRTNERAHAVRKTRAPQGRIDTGDDPQTEITELCSQAESLVVLMEAGADNNDPKNINIRDTTFERVCAIGDELAHYRSAAPADILGKIRLWRFLALEDALNPEKCSSDEQLLLSIIDDIEEHLRAQ